MGPRAVADLVRASRRRERRYARGAPTRRRSDEPPSPPLRRPSGARRDWQLLKGPPTGDEAAAVANDAERRGRVAANLAEITKAESWHRGGAGTLRAIVFGASDGLVSNLSLVMGVAGATPEPSFILLSGIAGLLAGAFSMAAGEYISVRSQVEVLERQIALERAELEAIPEEELEELVAIYRSKGLPEADARRFAEHIFQDKEVALQTMVREELGWTTTDELAVGRGRRLLPRFTSGRYPGHPVPFAARRRAEHQRRISLAPSSPRAMGSMLTAAASSSLACARWGSGSGRDRDLIVGRYRRQDGAERTGVGGPGGVAARSARGLARLWGNGRRQTLPTPHYDKVSVWPQAGSPSGARPGRRGGSSCGGGRLDLPAGTTRSVVRAQRRDLPRGAPARRTTRVRAPHRPRALVAENRRGPGVGASGRELATAPGRWSGSRRRASQRVTQADAGQTEAGLADRRGKLVVPLSRCDEEKSARGRARLRGSSCTPRKAGVAPTVLWVPMMLANE